MSATPTKPRSAPRAGKPRSARKTAAAGAAPASTPHKTTGKAAPRERMKSVKGSYKIPKSDYALFAVLKERAAATGVKPRKNDLIRAGLHALMESGRVELRRMLDRLPSTKK